MGRAHGAGPRNRVRLAVAVAVLAAGVLAGCSSTPRRNYQDDGPPDRVPANLATLPDAVPRLEPLHPFANRPYMALGQTYTPETVERPYKVRGVASWYGRQFHGNRTASGEPYDMFAMTAAHPTLPIPSYARVTNAVTGQRVVVRINDRGPFLRDRVIDLSYAAAVRLGIAASGSGEVEVERILPAQIVAQRAAAGAAGAALPGTAPGAAGPRDATAGLVSGTREAPGDTMAPTLPAAPGTDPVAIATPVLAFGAISSAGDGASAGALSGLPSSAMASSASPIVAGGGAVPRATGAAAEPGPVTRWALQLGAFSVPANAAALRDELAAQLARTDPAVLPDGARTPWVERDGALSRVLVGALARRDEALALAQRLKALLGRDVLLLAR